MYSIYRLTDNPSMTATDIPSMEPTVITLNPSIYPTESPLVSILAPGFNGSGSGSNYIRNESHESEWSDTKWAIVITLSIFAALGLIFMVIICVYMVYRTRKYRNTQNLEANITELL